jgi:HD-GYP domain-containing protein (c-di-GMP phosphodiesterase class II)
MIQVPLEIAVKSGARLAKPIYGTAGQVLLREGIVLNSRFADRLSELGISAVFIEGGKVKVDEPIAVDVRLKASQALGSVGRGLEKVNLCAIVSDILDDVLSLRGIVESVSSICTYDGYTYTHSVDVSVISMSVGLQLGYKRHTLLELGIGGLMHDIGKLKIPYDIINKPGTLSEDEFDLVKTHTVQGYELIKNHKQVSSRSAAMVLEHHERWDGRGYPDGKKKREIQLFSAICGVADIYNAMTTTRSYRPAHPPHEVYEFILGMGDTFFDYEVIKAFARCIVPYPRGTLVRTSDLRVAQVVSNDTDHPYLPVVVFLDDPEDKEVNLLKAGLTVKSAVTLEEKEFILLNHKLPVPVDERRAS